MQPVERVAVLGTGTMGPSIAATFLAAGIDVTLWGRQPQRTAAAEGRAQRLVEQLVTEGLTGEYRGSLRVSTDLHEAGHDAQLVVEAISEDAGTKRSLYDAAEDVIPRTCLLASTTSGLGPAELARECRHPERFLVLHFWNPAHLIPLVEVLGHDRTPVETLDHADELLRSLGKHPVRLNKFAPGFIGTRLQQAVVREAIALLEAGVASAADIDAATRLSFGARFPVMGPLETSDLGGLDVVRAIHDYLLADLDTSASAQAALTERVDRGDLGVKSGRGFYDWHDRDPAQLAEDRDVELLSRVHRLREQGRLSRTSAVGPA